MEEDEELTQSHHIILILCKLHTQQRQKLETRSVRCQFKGLQWSKFNSSDKTNSITLKKSMENIEEQDLGILKVRNFDIT